MSAKSIMDTVDGNTNLAEAHAKTLQDGEGYIYIATNPAMKGLCKIGLTYNLTERLRSLYVSSVPMPFEYFYAAKVACPEWVEDRLHEAFEDRRVTNNREFFEMEPRMARSALELAALEDVTSMVPPAPSCAENNERFRNSPNRERLDLVMLGIDVGETLTWLDDPEIFCIVTTQKPARVLLNGEEMSLSKSATHLRQSKNSLQGSRHWCYEGETLQKRRERLERENAILQAG